MCVGILFSFLFIKALIIFEQNSSIDCSSMLLKCIGILSTFSFIFMLFIGFLDMASATLFSLPFLYKISKLKSKSFKVRRAILADGILRFL
jgi:hypothetical protein